MTYPIPDRLAPVRREVRQRKVLTVLAVIAAVLAILAGLDVTIGSLSPFDLACFALAALSLHFVGPLVAGWRARP